MNFLKALFFLLAASFQAFAYTFSLTPIDVIIPCAPKDLLTLEHCIEGIRKNGKDVRRVIVISQDRLTDKAEWFAESRFPFSKESLALEIFQNQAEAREYLATPSNRIGWIYQQFLKFYAGAVIPGISDNVLVLDADTIFLNPVTFRDEKGQPYFTTVTEYHPPYFEHMRKLLPGLDRIYPNRSGVVHHMLFQRPVLQDLFTQVESLHHTDFWKALCRTLNHSPIDLAAMSEYEIYFNFLLKQSPSQVIFRPLRWKDEPRFERLAQWQRHGYAYISSHDWQRPH